ncbi:MAG: Arm DNA-binding domain-containing protein [Clostridiales bacterium]|nr:Arm DNA-binding domain-containing protein [Clostridiales bacterium]
MSVTKDKKTNTWMVQCYYTDWTGARKRKKKRGFSTKKDGQEWERQFLQDQSSDLNMSMESFVDVYFRDKELQTDLEKIEYSLQCQENQDKYANQTGEYNRYIERRCFIVEEYFGDMSAISQFGMLSTNLFEYAQNKDFSVTLPTGFMFSVDGDAVRQFVYYEVINPAKEDEKIISIPKGKYSCRQVEFDPKQEYLQISYIKSHYSNAEHRLIIISNLMRDRLPANSRYNEIQVLDGYSIPGL